MVDDEESEDDSLEEVMAGFISPDESGWATGNVWSLANQSAGPFM